MRCATWTEHEWERGALIDSGRHATMGRFVKYLAVCRRCALQTTETHWLELPVERRGDDERTAMR